MNTLRNTGKMWMFLFGLTMFVGAIIIAIFATNRHTEIPQEAKDYTEDIRALNDTIAKLQRDIEEYERKIALIDLERETLRNEIQEILSQNEKTDSIIVSNNLDANIRYLSDYLSKSDSSGGHFGLYHSSTTDDHKQDDKSQGASSQTERETD